MPVSRVDHDSGLFCTLQPHKLLHKSGPNLSTPRANKVPQHQTGSHGLVGKGEAAPRDAIDVQPGPCVPWRCSRTPQVHAAPCLPTSSKGYSHTNKCRYKRPAGAVAKPRGAWMFLWKLRKFELSRRIKATSAIGYQAPGTRHQAPGTRHQAPGTRHQAPGARLVFRPCPPSWARWTLGIWARTGTNDRGVTKRTHKGEGARVPFGSREWQINLILFCKILRNGWKEHERAGKVTHAKRFCPSCLQP